jgi:hypothetical protein
VHGLGAAEGDSGIVDVAVRVPARSVVAIRHYSTPSPRFMLAINEAG